jgi:ankyrin repeat protein
LLGLAIVNDYPLSVIKQLIGEGAQLDPPRMENGNQESRESLLMLAAARAYVIAALLIAGADPNLVNDFGKTALMYAVQEQGTDAVRALIEAGAIIDTVTNADVGCTVLKAGSRSALMYAA